MAQGIQDQNVQKVDLIFTKRGRFYKSINSDKVKITKFALSDDGVDYGLYEEGAEDNEKAIKILRTPQFESFTSETGLMRNKLISLERDTTETTTLDVTPERIEFEVDPNSTQKVMVESVTIRAGFPVPNGFIVSLDNAEYVYVNNPPKDEIEDEDEDDDDDIIGIPRNVQLNQSSFQSPLRTTVTWENTQSGGVEVQYRINGTILPSATMGNDTRHVRSWDEGDRVSARVRYINQTWTNWTTDIEIRRSGSDDTGDPTLPPPVIPPPRTGGGTRGGGFDPILQ